MTSPSKPLPLYATRCSPNCPYEWCVILTDIPPQEEREKSGQSSQQTRQQESNDQSGNNQSNQESEQDNVQEQQRPSTSSPSQGGKKSPPRSQGDNQSPEDVRETDDRDDRNDPGQSDQGQRPSKASQGKLPKKEQKPQKPIDYKPVFQPNIPLKDIAFRAGGGGIGDEALLQAPVKHAMRGELMTDLVFVTRLKSVLSDNAFDRRVKGRKRGHLDMRSLYKVPSKVENIFTLKESRKNKHYNVVLLVDQSGSMGSGQRSNKGLAADCATLLARALDKAGINYEVIGFDSSHIVYKTLNQDLTVDSLKKLNYDLIVGGGGGTDLWPAVQQAYNDVKLYPEYKNIVIGLTDGGTSNSDYIIHYVNGNKRRVDYIDVGLRHKGVLPNSIRINNINQLKPLLIRELRKRVQRG